MGALWTPNHIEWFLDDQKISEVWWSENGQPTPASNPPGPDGTFSILDKPRKGMTLILGCGPGFPFHIDYVNVWGDFMTKIDFHP